MGRAPLTKSGPCQFRASRARLFPRILAKLPETIPGWKLAPFTTALIVGSVGADATVSVKVAGVNPATVAVTLAAPALLPRVTSVDACPDESVCAVVVVRIAFEAEKATVTPGTGFI